MWFVVLGGVILLAAIAAGIAWVSLRGDESAGAGGIDGPCVRETFAPMGRQHVEEVSKDFEYSSFPPTSGPHHPLTAIWNPYEEPVPQLRLVHNLEHGGVAVQYGSEVPQQTVEQIRAWYAESPNGLVVAPLPPADEIQADAPPDAESKIFLTAWTHLATCSSFDEQAFNGFLDDFRNPNGDAPETPNFPLDSLQPGGN
jgi:hypothetical protein